MRAPRVSLALALLMLVADGTVAAADGIPVGPREGLASWYGPGSGVATQWCTWTLRHATGCGYLAIQSHQTGLVAIAPVVDWCQCYRGTDQERIVDLQWGVVDALGLDRADGLYPVTTWPVDGDTGLSGVPDTAMGGHP